MVTGPVDRIKSEEWHSKKDTDKLDMQQEIKPWTFYFQTGQVNNSGHSRSSGSRSGFVWETGVLDDELDADVKQGISSGQSVASV